MLLPRYRQDNPRYTTTVNLRSRSLHDKLRQIETRDNQALATITAGPTEATPYQQLRGIPCIATGVGGTQPGTNPPQALMAKQRRNP